MRRFNGISMEKVPEENTIFNVCHPLETVHEYLVGQDLTVQERDDTGCQHHWRSRTKVRVNAGYPGIEKRPEHKNREESHQCQARGMELLCPEPSPVPATISHARGLRLNRPDPAIQLPPP